jgi:hypothetical protein
MNDIQEKLKMIVPGKTYPQSVHIVEQVDGKEMKIRFLLQSYVVGMYCAIHFPHCQIPEQTGDHNNKTLVAKLKKDIAKAIERGAQVEIGAIIPIKEFDTA